MVRWESPLKKGQIVTCDDGYVVRIIEDPVWTGSSYTVKIDVLVGRYGMGSQSFPRDWDHLEPDRFVESRIISMEQHKTLEDEFFERVCAE